MNGRNSSLLVLAISLLITAAVAGKAMAACNAIPDAESLVIGADGVLFEQNPMMPSTPVEPGLIGFKGTLGRMDRIHLLPGHTASFRIQPDGRCVQASEGKLTVLDLTQGRGDPRLNASNLVASLVTRPARGGSPQALALGSKETCEMLMPDEKGEAKSPSLGLRCKSLPLEIEPREGEGFNVRVRLVDNHGNLLAAEGARIRGPVAVVLTPRPKSRAEHVALLLEIAADGCAAHCTALQDIEALGCIDLFYAVVPEGTAVFDSVPCGVGVFGNVPKNNFKEKCEDLSALNQTLASCDNNANPGVLEFWEDQCGGVHIPFDWTGIRKDVYGGDVTRIVAGRSATSRTEKGQGERVWIPGREFIGSTPWNDPEGTAATTDWRKPDVDVWYPPDSPKEVGLRGSTDEPDSIVHIFPRMPVSLLCAEVAGDEACMGVEGGGGVSCACRDRYPAGCFCVKPNVPKFFACEGGDFEGMPCTRHAHCNSAPGSPNPDGTCSGQPTCQKDDKNGVWQSPGSPPGSPSGTPCWTDNECTQANRPACGYRLFDIGDRNDNLAKPEQIELDANIVTGARLRRGVCKGKRTKVCNPGSGCAAKKEGDCRGYTLSAGGKKP